VAVLESIALFRNLGPEELRTLQRVAQERKFDAGSEIFKENTPGDGIYFVKEGLVEIGGAIGASDRHIFSQLGPGEIFGEMAVIEDCPRSAAARALTNTEVYFIPREEMLSLLQHSPMLAFDLLRLISHRLREFNHLHLREMVEAESLAVIGRFAQGIIHDLKNPLSIIGLSAEMFDMPNIRPEMRAKAQARIKKQVNRISDLVGDILIFTENKRSETQVQPLDFRKFILEVIPELQSEAEMKDAEIVLQTEPPSACVPINARRLGRVFHNLIHNATEVMLNGGKIFIRFRMVENEIVTEIEDTGPGIAPEIARTLFQPFATFGKSQGSGLGLSICKKIIEDHRGRIDVRSEAGRGAIFTFVLPMVK
jgi:signal transduction histidine kinase